LATSTTGGISAYHHQDLPFEQLVEELQPERNLSYSPLFQVLLQLQDAPLSQLEWSGLTVTQLALESMNVKFDLTLILEKTTDGLVGEIQYNTDLFKASTIERLQEHLKILLSSMVANPQQSIYQLPLLTENEQQQLVAWNDTAMAYPTDQTIIDLFEQQVNKTPDNIAVVFEEQQLTYQQLNDQANQLAHYLLSLQTQAGTILLSNNSLIAIAVERSLEMIIGLLGILKAGGAYVPIDPSYPAARIRYLLADSAAPLLLTQSHLKTQLSLEALEHECVVVYLENVDFIKQSIANPLVNRQATDLAYVIYTSGSTGKPKGVMVEHISVLNLVFGLHKTIYNFYDHSQLRVSMNGALVFDTSVKQLIQLLSGHILDVMPNEVRFNQKALLTYFQEHQIDVFDCTPSHFNLISENLFYQNISIPHIILIGGEPLNELTWRFLQSAKTTRYYNLYGSTECTVDTCICTISNTSIKPIIGRPIINTYIYILDNNNQPQPPGIPGELCIAGAGLARGYLNRPDLTAEKFIEVELFGKIERIYKTGDLARWLEDGNLEFLGRMDNQVKIRGFRIELGEIEAVLATHPMVNENVVMVHETESGNKRLVAFIVPSQGQIIDNQALRTFLTEHLPDYMIPSVLVVKASLPLTPNGKIDRQALSQLAVNSYQLSDKALVAPRDSIELQLVHIWEVVLNVRPVGVRDNFFELGGHSLLAVSLMAQIQQQFNQSLPLATLFQGATIEQLATRLRQPTATLAWSPLVAIQPQGDKTPLFAVHPGGGQVLCYLELAQHLGIEQPFYGLQAVGMEAGQVPFTQVEEMATFYLQALSTVQPQGPYQLIGWSFGGVVALEMAKQLQAQGQSVALLALLDTVTPAGLVENSPEYSASQAQLLVDLFAETNISLSLEHLQLLNSDEQFAYVIEQGQQVNLFSPAVKPANIKRLLEVYQANRQAFQHYQPQLYRGKITCFSATERSDNLSLETSWGWEKFTTVDVEHYLVPGNHYSMVRSPNVGELAKQLKRCLENIS
jgi:amino acid adenylation domain-containing protein